MSVDLEHIVRALTRMPADERAEVERMAAAVPLRWVPNPGPQTEAYQSQADELFFGGEAGGGKSDLGIGLALDCHHRSLILREFKDDARALGERLCEIVGARSGWNENIA